MTGFKEAHVQLPFQDISIPQDLLALANAPVQLKRVPYYQIGSIFFGNYEAEIVGSGVAGMGFKIRLNSEDPAYFLKLYYDTPIQRLTLINFLLRCKRVHQLSLDGAKMTDEPHPAKLEHMRLMRLVEGQAFAHLLGHRIRSDLVEDLHAVWAHQGTPVGYTMVFIEGKAVGINRAMQIGGESFREALSELTSRGIFIDTSMTGLNVIETPTRKLKLVDLDFNFNRERAISR